MKVIPLGISSGKPTLRRNVSATALIREREWLLFDCGEGAQMQIARAGISPSKLAAVFLTHFHGDHVNGLSGLLSTLGLDRRERELSLIAPEGIHRYLDTLTRLRILYVNYPLKIRELGISAASRQDVDPESLLETDRRRGIWFPEVISHIVNGDGQAVFETEEYRVDARPLDHRIFTLGYRIEEKPRPGRFDVERARSLGIPEGPMFGLLQSGGEIRLSDGRVVRSADVVGPPRPGKSIAYCTDTRPCSASVELGRGVDLLIHEATFIEEQSAEAREFGHSTAAQAGRIAAESGAKRLLITHFSPRYQDPKLLLDEARAVFPNTVLAEELTEIAV